MDNPDKIEVALENHFQKWQRYFSTVQVTTTSYNN